MQKIAGTVQNYAWGSPDGIPRILGTEPGDEPQAEYWLGAHPKAPSTLADGTALDEFLATDPALIGAATTARFGRRLPYLLKILSASQALSLQAHPSRSQAIEGYARENAEGVEIDAGHRNYRDDWPKPEAMVALTEFHGLCGFRDPNETKELVARLGVPGADELMEPLPDPDGIARVFLEILALAADEAELIADVVAAATPHVGEDSEFGRMCTTAVELNEDYPGDPGVLAALMLNPITLHPGEAFFMPAGNLHAYVRGTGIEIMSNSDNVLRGGLTAKHIDIDELARVVDFSPGFPGLLQTDEVAAGVRRYRTPAPEFALFEVTDAPDTELPAAGGRILLVIDGWAELTSGTPSTPGGAETLRLERGEAAFVAGTETGVRLRTAGHAFLAAPGV